MQNVNKIRPPLWLALAATLACAAVIIGLSRHQAHDVSAAVSQYTWNGNPTLVTNDGARPEWSPDGNWIYFDREGDDGCYDVWKIQPNGSNATCITCDDGSLPNKNMGTPALSPDGRWLVFEAERSDKACSAANSNPGGGKYANLWVRDNNTGSYYQLTDVGSSVGGSLHPHFNSDGTQLLWSDRQNDGGSNFDDWRLAVADFVTTGTPHLSNVTYYEPATVDYWYEAMGWGPDDSYIYFVCQDVSGQEDGMTMDICKMDFSDTSHVTRLTQNSGIGGESRAWNEHSHLSPRNDVYAWGSSSGFSLPTSWLFFFSNFKTELWLMNADGSNKTQVSSFNDSGSGDYAGSTPAAVTDLSWDPVDEDRLVAFVQLYGNANPERLYIIDFTYDPNTPTPTPTLTSTPTPSPTPTGCTSGNTGWLNPSANAADTGGDNNGYETNPTNAYADESGYATNADGVLDRHRYYNYSASIPAGCSIKGIEVKTEWSTDSGTWSPTMVLDLSWNGGTSWTSTKTTPTGSGSWRSDVLGSTSDTWSRSWATSELSNANFRVRIKSNCSTPALCGLKDYYLDWLPIRVTYGP